MAALDVSTLTVLTLVALVVAVALLVVCIVLMVRFTQLRAQLKAVFPAGVEDVVVALDRQQQATEMLRGDIATVHANTEHLRDRLQGALSRVGLVRYDAFSDVAGAQSFSVALLDRRNNGVVISAIHGRSESRCYGKDITDGQSTHQLSDEEKAAIEAAIEGRPVTTLTPGRKRRRAS